MPDYGDFQTRMGNYDAMRVIKYERERFRTHVDRELKMKKNAVINTILLSSLCNLIVISL